MKQPLSLRQDPLSYSPHSLAVPHMSRNTHFQALLTSNMRSFSFVLLILVSVEASAEVGPAPLYGVLQDDIAPLLNNTLATFGSLLDLCSTETQNVSSVGGTGIAVLQNFFHLQLEATEAENRYLKEKLQTLQEEYTTVKDQVLQWHQGLRNLNPLIHASDRSLLKPEQWPKDCQDLFLQGHNVSKVYTIYPRKCGSVSEGGVRVWCEMDTQENVGWSVIISRRIVEEQVDFNQGWKKYRLGFGDPETEHWIGNDVIHAMTSGVRQTLRVDLEDHLGVRKYAEYTLFQVDSADQEYQLHVNGYSGTAGDSFRHNKGYRFTTPDRDNDGHSSNCAEILNSGGFWYTNCGEVSATGQLSPNRGNQDTTRWHDFHNKNLGLRKMIFKLRPTLCDL